jgi:hypothetical protein
MRINADNAVELVLFYPRVSALSAVKKNFLRFWLRRLAVLFETMTCNSPTAS